MTYYNNPLAPFSKGGKHWIPIFMGMTNYDNPLAPFIKGEINDLPFTPWDIISYPTG
jgi:hypothetical protein